MFLWPWDIIQPIRSYFARRRSRWKQNWSKGTCPSCKLPFDNGRKRCVVDSCGHCRCYSCLCVGDTCPVCIRNTVVYRKANKFDRRPHRIEKRKANDIARHTLLDISNELSFSIPKESGSSGVYQKGQRLKRVSYNSSQTDEYSFDKLFSNTPECFQSLKPLYFEVPQPESENEFLYREWVFQEISKIFTTNSRGVALVGEEGSGKTTLILQLVDWSCFGRKRKSGLINEGMLSDVRIFENLASKVVGYHFCQADCLETCLFPVFVHSLAAQLCQAPQLAEYRNYLIRDVSCQQMLTLESCINDPDTAFKKGILEPLCSLNSLHLTSELIVIDNIDEGEEQQRSIISFLSAHIKEFPDWLKIVLTIKMVDVDKICSLPFQQINLGSSEFKVQEDLFRYARSRISNSEVIQTNICSFGGQISRLVDHLVTGGQASFLFMRLILDLFQQNYLVIKSNTFNVIPVSLNEVFTLSFNLKFPSSLTFNKVKPILEICLASQTPLTALEIFYTLELASVIPEMKWVDFTQILHSLYGILIQRKDESLMISHPALRNWLKKNRKFLCDVELGHTYLSLLPTRINLPLSKQKELEFLSHLSLSTLFKDEKLLKAYWLQFSSLDISRIFIEPRLIFWTDLKAIRLILESGADVNSTFLNSKRSPVINEASKIGNEELVRLLIEFKAIVDSSDIFGVTALMEAAIHGHFKVAKVLMYSGAKVHLQDKVGRCALSCAAENGFLDVVKFLHQINQWPSQAVRSDATQRALVIASGVGNLQILEFLIQAMNITVSDSILNQVKSGSTQGTVEMCKIFLNKNVSDSQIFLLSAFQGHIPILSILLDKGVDVNVRDELGRSAFTWASINNKKRAARFLLEKGADIAMKDQQQFLPIHFAAQHGDAEMIQMLMQFSANSEMLNSDKDTALECAIKARNFSTVVELLKYDAKIGDKAFKYAESQRHLYCSLLCKLLSNGVTLYKNGQVTEAIQVFQYGSSKCSLENSQRLLHQFQKQIEQSTKMLDKRVSMLSVKEDTYTELL